MLVIEDYYTNGDDYGGSDECGDNYNNKYINTISDVLVCVEYFGATNYQENLIFCDLWLCLLILIHVIGSGLLSILRKI